MHRTASSTNETVTAAGASVPTFEVLKVGVHSTIQDCGRTGDYISGIPPSGAQDLLSFRLASVVVGNSSGRSLMARGGPGDAGIEVLLKGLRLRVLRDAIIAIGGWGIGVLNGNPIPSYTAVSVKEGDDLLVDRGSVGLRSYLVVAGGIDVPFYLGSRSLLVRGRIGGVDGRALARGDVLSVFESDTSLDGVEGRALPPELIPDFSEYDSLRVQMGPQDDLFTEESIDDFLSKEWTVSPVSDRMAYRIIGPQLRFKPRPDYLDLHAGPDPSHIVCDPIPVGGIQVPSGLQLLIMGVDGGSLGGFAKIACVISPDMSRMGQMRPGQTLRFEAVDDARALELRHQEEERVQRAQELLAS
jgi:biotin-dependent carboxylase-like uncharacterized protein